jgi:DNA-binding SARP family transcriptional activator
VHRILFGVLGSLEAVALGRQVLLGGRRQRAVLAILLLEANRTLPAERLINLVWAEPPATADGVLQNYISRLRGLLDEKRDGRWSLIRTGSSGYALSIDLEAIDAYRFEQEVSSARRASRDGRLEEAIANLRKALGEWRGPVLVDFPNDPFALGERARLEQLRMAATEELADAQIDLGRVGEALEVLQKLVLEHPLNESIRAKQMKALYRSGRQSEALASYRELRLTLAREMGLDPSPEVVTLHRHILQQDLGLSTV